MRSPIICLKLLHWASSFVVGPCTSRISVEAGYHIKIYAYLFSFCSQIKTNALRTRVDVNKAVSIHWEDSSVDVAKVTLWTTMKNHVNVSTTFYRTGWSKRFFPFSKNIIELKHGFSCINIRQVPWEVLKTAAAVSNTSQGTWRMLMH